MNAPVDVTNIRIETGRLVLRAWRESDLADFYEYASVDGVGQMAGWLPHKSMEESKQILDLFIREKKTFALEYKENGKVIGSLGLETRDGALDVPEESMGREIGYVLSRDYWGRGLMPEAVRAVIDYCFRELDFDWLACGHFIRNDRSRRVVEKCGFVYVKDILYKTRFDTEEPSKLYILENTRKIAKKMTAPVDVTNIRIETDRLLLRPMQETDLEDYHEYHVIPEVADMTGWSCSESLEVSRQRLHVEIEARDGLAVVLKETGKMIGGISLQSRNWSMYPIDRSSRGREFGVELNKAYWGRGLMPEAVRAVTDYCFDTLNYDFLTAGHFLRNARSARMIEKCGFAFLFEAEHTMPSGVKEQIRTYILYNPHKEKKHV